MTTRHNGVRPHEAGSARHSRRHSDEGDGGQRHQDVQYLMVLMGESTEIMKRWKPAAKSHFHYGEKIDDADCAHMT
jgi:hypothetical protein